MFQHTSTVTLVSFAAVIRVVTRHATLLPTSGEERCVTSDDPNNGCEGDYCKEWKVLKHDANLFLKEKPWGRELDDQRSYELVKAVSRRLDLEPFFGKWAKVHSCKKTAFELTWDQAQF